MNKILLILGFMICSNFCFADFVDVATVKVNNKLIRNLTLNSTPYLICFSDFNPGDTMTISVWTDYGGEFNSYLTYRNMLTNEVDTINRKSKIILTADMIENTHLFSVTYISERNNKISKHSWAIFESTTDRRIEEIHSHLNLFVEELKSGFSNMNDFFLDSIQCNIFSPKLGKNGLRQTKDTLLLAQNELLDVLVLTDEEREYLLEFNSIDYVQLFNLETRMYGQIQMDYENLNWVTLRLANFSGSSLRFNFIFEKSRFKLKSVIV